LKTEWFVPDWGMPAERAKQRIGGGCVLAAILDALFSR
jgi:hypothetical protein